jgi:hypothetical protein
MWSKFLAFAVKAGVAAGDFAAAHWRGCLVAAFGLACFFAGCHCGRAHGGEYHDPTNRPAAVAALEPATIRVIGCGAAALTIDGGATQARGDARTFASPPLRPGPHHYTIAVEVKPGKWVEQAVTIYPGCTTEVQVDIARGSVADCGASRPAPTVVAWPTSFGDCPGGH